MTNLFGIFRSEKWVSPLINRNLLAAKRAFGQPRTHWQEFPQILFFVRLLTIGQHNQVKLKWPSVRQSAKKRAQPSISVTTNKACER